MERHFEETAADNATRESQFRNREKKAYVAPEAEVIEVCVEQGFAVTAPGFDDGGDI